MADHRSLPVPDGLEGERLDAALARLFGLSRTRAAEVIAAGDVLVDGQAGAKSDRMQAGSWLEITLPAPPSAPVPEPQPVPGMAILHEDTDIVVVDKPIGVAAHPTTGWTGPTWNSRPMCRVIPSGSATMAATSSPRSARRT